MGDGVVLAALVPLPLTFPAAAGGEGSIPSRLAGHPRCGLRKQALLPFPPSALISAFSFLLSNFPATPVPRLLSKLVKQRLIPIMRRPHGNIMAQGDPALRRFPKQPRVW